MLFKVSVNGLCEHLSSDVVCREEYEVLGRKYFYVEFRKRMVPMMSAPFLLPGYFSANGESAYALVCPD